jgi:hypothetical protein
MKKKLFIPIIVIVLVLIIGVIGFIIFNNNKVVSTVTLDINPSIEINLNSNEKVVSIKALNDDAKDIVNDDLKGKSLEDSLNIITDNLIDKGYAFEGEMLEVILYSEGDISNSQLEEKVTRSLREKNIGSSIVIVDEITDEDKDLAEKYNISPAKVSYIKTITNDNEKINIDDLANKSVKEIVDTKEHGLYCDKEYTLEGNVCLKEIDRVPAQKGEVCPGGYQEYNGVCYEETGSIEGPNDYCPDEFEMVDGKCKKHSFYEPLPNCKDNRYDSNSRKCIELVYVEDAIEFCRDPGRTLYDHKCLATKPSINGGCLGNDMYYNGKCLNPINDYYMSEYKCSNGQVISGADGSLLYGDTKCYEENPVDATYLECDRGFTFDGINCVHDEEMNIQKERICPSGYTKIEFDRCINLNNSSNKTDGYVCTGENERPAGNECIIYEVIDAIQY